MGKSKQEEKAGELEMVFKTMWKKAEEVKEKVELWMGMWMQSDLKRKKCVRNGKKWVTRCGVQREDYYMIRIVKDQQAQE